MLKSSFAPVARLTALLFVLLSPPVLAQHAHHYHSGVQMGLGYQGFGHSRSRYAGPGHIGPGYIGPGYIGPGNVGFGNFGSPGNVAYGRSGFVQQFGGVSISSARYSSFGNGTTVFGVARSPRGVFHYSSGLVVPSIVTSSIYGSGYGYSPWNYGYGSGLYGGGLYGGGWGSPSYGVLAVGGGIDPFTGIAVSYNPWCAQSVPYFGGVNPYFPGSILGSTLFSMSLSMRPSVPSTASYTLTDPRILDFVAPAPNMMAIPDPGIPAQPVPDAPPLPDPAAGVPLLNEFESFERIDKVSTLAEKIHSLRYQATGDDSFRKEDYASADVFYKSAIEMAPDRRAPYVRMAFVQIALADFPKAVSYLKAGAMMPDDGTRSWVSAEELYGSKVAQRARSHGGQLWNWLAQQPLSSDRLLLAGTFQKLRGFDSVGSELLSMASHEGSDAACVTAINAIASSDIGQRAISHELAQLVQEASAKTPVVDLSTRSAEVTSKSASSGNRQPEAGGIFLRGKRAASGPTDNSSQVATSSVEVPTLVIPSTE